MEFIEFKYFKSLAIYSFILSAGCGLISAIPIFMPVLALFFLPFFGCIAPLYLLIKRDNFSSYENKTYAVLGGISGACLTVGYIITFIPVVFLIHLINKNYYGYGTSGLNLFLFVMFFVMIAIVYATTNSVCGLIFGIIYNYFKGKQNG